MKKLLILLFSIFFLSSPSVFAETYACSQELERFGRRGEVETLAYKRVGKSFKSPPFLFQIFDESKSTIILTNIVPNPDPSMLIVFINKDTKEFGQTILSMEEYRLGKQRPFSYGKCIVVQ